jgi:LmbE family N-acetylglucosaminyl deacetylase
MSSQSTPKVVLGIAAHADDLDFGASGTIARYAAEGAEIYYLILTDGSKGSADPEMTAKRLKAMRQEEQQAALKILGGREVFFLDYVDGELEVTQKLKCDIVRVIRKVKPELVITMDPSMIYSANRGYINHPDHRAAGQAALDAVFPLARDHLAFPDICEEGFMPHKTLSVLLINFDRVNYYCDITNFIDKKVSALAAHASQMTDMEATENCIRNLAKEAGEQAGYELAEGFIRIDIRDLSTDRI